jgi:hypothetical protein
MRTGLDDGAPVSPFGHNDDQHEGVVISNQNTKKPAFVLGITSKRGFCWICRLLKMSIAGLLTASSTLADTARRIQQLLRLCDVLLKEISTGEPGSPSVCQHDKVRMCLVVRQRLIDARTKAAALVFRRVSTSWSDNTSTLAIEELMLSKTLDEMERDWYNTTSVAFDNDISIIEVETVTTACADEAAGREKTVDLPLVPSGPSATLNSSSSSLEFQNITVSEPLLQRREEVENRKVTLEAGSRASGAEKWGLRQEDIDHQPSSFVQLESPPIIVNDDGRNNTARRSLARMADVKSMREKLQRNIESSLDTFKAETTNLYQEVSRLRTSEKCLMEQVLQEQESLSQLKAANQALERQVATLLLPTGMR